jgi:endonuclease/exonuclease/phosphatase family metal-dependent hydrolase
MKIYSWNVLRSNRKLEEVYGFIEKLDFDVLCLQEVTEEMLSRFKQMPFHIAYNVERFAENSRSKVSRNYAVILSRPEIRSQGKIQFPELLRTFNSNRFEAFMKRVEKWESVTNLGAVYADIEIEGKLTRVFCVHLALWNPQTRTKEFEHLMEFLPKEGPTIVCGDFNILEYGPIKILNWLLSGSFYEGMPWYPERRLFEERFTKHNFKNPLRGMITHAFSHSQLDHVLLSPELTSVKSWVEEDSRGSDHQPVGVEAYMNPESAKPTLLN